MVSEQRAETHGASMEQGIMAKSRESLERKDTKIDTRLWFHDNNNNNNNNDLLTVFLQSSSTSVK